MKRFDIKRGQTEAKALPHLWRNMKARLRIRCSGSAFASVCFAAVAAISMFFATAHAADIVRSSGSTAAGAGTPAQAAAVPTGNAAGVPETARINAQARLTAARDALTAVRAMQAAAANLSRQAVAGQANGSGTWNLGRDGRGNAIVVSSGLSANGLVPEGGVVKDPNAASPGATVTFVMPGSWSGVSRIAQTTTAADPARNVGSATATTVDVTQTQQQAILTWDKFNLAPDTTLNFDQSLGGADVGNWIAFNKIGVTGNPSQILGSLKTLGPKHAKGDFTTGGQVYVINPNGIIFGGTAQVNAHAIVASSLPINDNLIARGLLNNPDGQFHFTGLSLTAGAQTDAFTPLLSETVTPTATAGGNAFTSALKVAGDGNVTVTYPGSSVGSNALVKGDDYTVAKSSAGQATVSFTTKGLAKVAGNPVKVAYTPSGDSYGDVVVKGGAHLISPTSAESVGGRIALIGPNVTNAGTLTAPDGQVVLAAGLQVGMAAHGIDSIQTAVATAQAAGSSGPATNDPSLRGLDFYVGKVTFPDAPKGYSAGTVTNAREVSGSNVVTMGLIQTTDLFRKNSDGSDVGPVDVPGSVLMTGKTVNEMGVIASATTVSFNGRIDLLANYNAFGNPAFDSTSPLSRPFVFDSSDSTGIVTLGAGSLVQIMPSLSLTEKVNSTPDLGLSLRSQVNLQGSALHLASTVPENASAVPADAIAAVIRAPNAEVNFLAGSWTVDRTAASPANKFYYAGGQVYLDRGTLVDVSGTQAAAASVTENIIDVQLRGSELADSPLQRQGALRGKTVQVDLRVHGPWDPTKNEGRGGYAWVGTPVADASGYVNLVQLTVGELTVAGGTVNLYAGGSVVVRDGAKIDVSGGWIDYAGGHLQTTKVISGGHLYDISQATPDRIYEGIFDGTTTTIDPKWGVSEKMSNQTLLGYDDPGYFQGGNGGKVKIGAPSVALDGRFTGLTWSGPRQVLVSPAAGSFGVVAKPSEFHLGFQSQYLIGPTVYTYSPTPPNVTFTALPSGNADSSLASFKADVTGAYALPKQRQDDVELSAELINRAGFGFVSVDTSDDKLGVNGRKNNAGDFGRITVALNPTDPKKPLLTFGSSSASLAYYQQQGLTSATDSLSLLGAKIDLLGGIASPGGTLAFRATNVSRSYADAVSQARDGFPALLDPIAGRGALTVGASAALDVSGQVVDFRDPATGLNTPLSTVGGRIRLNGYQTEIAEGSALDVSGGAVAGDNRKVSWGSAGELELTATNEQEFFGARLTLPKSYRGLANSSFALRGFSGTIGGKLSITAPLVQIGGTAAAANSLVLDPLLFGQGGFSRYKITGLPDPTQSTVPALWLGAPTVGVDKTTGLATSTPTKLTIAPQSRSYQADLTQTGRDILQTFVPEAPFRTPVSLEFVGQGVTSSTQTSRTVGAVMVDNGVSISLTPNARSQVSVSGDTVTLFGNIAAPGGRVSLAGAKTTTSFPNGGSAPMAAVYVGPTSIISTAGASLVSKDPLGYNVGTVLSGGTIDLSGNIVAAKGALFDASGATGVVDVSPFQTVRNNIPDTSAAGSVRISTTIDSDGGTINLFGGETFFSDATLVAKAGGGTGRTSAAIGGTLNVDSGIFFAGGTVVSDARIPSLVLVASGPTIPVPFATGSTAVGRTVKDAKGNALSPSIGPDTTTPFFGGVLAASSFREGGFDWLNFAGSVEYSGAVSLKAGSGIQIGYSGAAVGGVLLANAKTPSSLALSAPYVALGQTFATPGNPFSNVDPTFGLGSLSVTGAKLIDVGNLSLRGISTADLKTVPGGDIRGNGSLELVGDLTLTAAQIYPPSAVTFNLIAYDHLPSSGPIEKGSITINRSGVPSQVPLSAGGQLNVYASTIAQNGVLRAPVGKINLGRDETATSPIPGKVLPVTDQVALSSGSVTSVSALDLSTGKPLSTPIPYGANLNGTSWIDPTGTDITVSDPAGRLIKNVTLSAAKIDDQKGSSIDVAGGGDLYTYRWVRGVNGSTDILNSNTTSFAILPDYKASYAPFGAFNNASSAQSNLSNDAGYTSIDPVTKLPRLKPGDTLLIDLDPTDTVGAQSYTLLPARYALLPGGFLVTPKSSVPSGTVQQADGSTLVAGYRYNALNSTRSLSPLYSMWEVAPAQIASGTPAPSAGAAARVDVVRLRAQYDGFLANRFFADVALRNNGLAPRLPLDGGQLVFAPRETITLDGKVNAQPLLGADGKPAKNADGSQAGRGGIVDIGSPLDILIAGPNTDLSDVAGQLVLDTNQLNGFGAESLLIGGIRSSGTDGTAVAVTTDNVVVDNGPALSSTGQVVKSGASLIGSDIVLAGNRAVAVLPGASVVQSGALPGGADKLTVTGTIKLTPGETVTFATGGAPISFPIGTGPATNGLTASVDSVVTATDGTTTNFKAGDTIKSLGAKSTLTLDATQAVPGTVLSIKVSTTSGPLVVNSGDGALLRVSSDPNAQIARSALTLATYQPTGIFAAAGLTVDQLGAPSALLFNGAKVSGGTGALIVDATGKTAIFSGASFGGKSMSLSSRSVSLAFDNSAGTSGSLLLSVADLDQIQKNGATSLSLLSYSSIDLYGSGTVGGPQLESLALHTPQLSGRNGGSVTFQANAIVLDNPTTGSAVATGSATPTGSLVFNATALNGKPGIIHLGSENATGSVRLDLFDMVRFSAESGLVFAGAGGFSAAGSDLADKAKTQVVVDTPLLTATAGARQSLLAGGALTLSAPSTLATQGLEGGLGATLSFRGTSVVANNRIRLPSGTLSLTATTGDVAVGGTLDLSGQAKTFIDVIRYTGGGQLNLTSDHGKIAVAEKGVLDVSAALDATKNDGHSRAGDAGTITINAVDLARGGFVAGGLLRGLGGISLSQDDGYIPGRAGAFLLDVGSVPDLNLDPTMRENRSLKPLNADLDAGGFFQERSLRVRQGNVIVDGVATAHTFNLGADQGSITVTGKIDASGSRSGTVNVAGKPSDAFGNRGGSIRLVANGSVVLAPGAELTVAAADFNAAGKGGDISLEAGASTGGVAPSMKVTRDANGRLVATDPLPPGQSVSTVDLQKGSKIDLSVAAGALPLAAGEKYTLPLGSRPGDIITADTSGKILKADGTVVAAFASGILPSVDAGNSVVLDQKGQLIYLVDTGKGTAAGTLRLRAPQAQTTSLTVGSTTTTLAPDVQINPIDATILGASSIAIEGYKAYQPLGGFIDTVAGQIDADGQLFAGSTNAAKIRTQLRLDAQSAAVVHIRPGAEIVSAPGGGTATQIAFNAPGSTSSLSVPAGGTIVVAGPTGPTAPVSTYALRFSAAVTLTPVEAGDFTATFSSTVPLNFAAGTTVTAPAAVATGRLTSSVAGTITLTNGTQISFAKDQALPQVPLGARLTFSGAGKLTITANVSLRVSFGAGQNITLPANSLVALSPKGGSVTFDRAGSLTWDTTSQAKTGLAVQLPTAEGSYTTGSAATSLRVGDAGWTAFKLNTAASFVNAGADTTVALPQGLGAGALTLQRSGGASGSMKVTLLSTREMALTLNAGDKITAAKGASLEDPTLTQISSTDVSPLSFSPLGGRVLFGSAAIVTVTGKARLEGSTTSELLPVGTAVTIPNGAALVFSGAGSVAVLPPLLPTSDPLSATIRVRTNLPAGQNTLAAGGTVYLVNAPDRVDLELGGIVQVSGAGAISFTSDAPSKYQLAQGSAVTLAVAGGKTVSTSATTVMTQASTNDLTLAANWDLSAFRYGEKTQPNATTGFATYGYGEPGVLTLRAKGNLIFSGVEANSKASLSDGFGPLPSAANGGLWQAPLLAAGSQSWTYRLVAGSDFNAADFRGVLPLDRLAPTSGSVLLGLGASALPTTTATRIARVPTFFQTIRTGTGDIAISAGRDVQLLNSLATIYTAGTQVADPTSLVQVNDFDLPSTAYKSTTQIGNPAQQYTRPYPAQYSFGGGNIAIEARGDITHRVIDPKTGLLVADSTKEMPTSWLYRRGYVDSTTGEFGKIQTRDATNIDASEIASTSWWTDYSNFFEGIGTLGGGNVSLVAGQNVENVDAVVATNARMTKQIVGGEKQATRQRVVELGGGDLRVRSGADLDAGVYYVERGSASIAAGGAIKTNATRSTVLANASANDRAEPQTWLPTTVFLGKGTADLSARGSLDLGWVANPFLLPQGINNSYFQRTLFSTGALDNAVTLNSLSSDVILHQSTAEGSLAAWYQNVFRVADTPAETAASGAQPWLRTNLGGKIANNLTSSLLPPTFRAVAFSGDIKTQGDFSLLPSPRGTLDLLADKSVKGLSATFQGNQTSWSSAKINLSDADPRRIPSPISPLGTPTPVTALSPVAPDFPLRSLTTLFTESGATAGVNVVLQTQQALHGPNLDSSAASDQHALHGGDRVPLRLYASSGDISGLDLFSAKSAQVSAGRDITDVGLYLQNARSDSVSVVSAGRDILAYNPNSPARNEALATGKAVGFAREGDIQISGPGELQVLAGRNVDLGAPLDRTGGAGNGTGVGIASVGNTRNPNLPFQGADITIGAGSGRVGDLNRGLLNFRDAVYRSGFIDRFLDPTTGGAVAAEHLPELGVLLGFTLDPKNPQTQNAEIWRTFNDPQKVSDNRRAELALDVFYHVLRDAGRDHNNPNRPGFGSYNEGYAAISTLFNGSFDFSSFIAKFITTEDATRSGRYVPELGKLIPGQSGASNQAILDTFNKTLTASDRNRLAAQIFALALHDAQPASSTAAGAFTAKDVVDTLYSRGGVGIPTLSSGNIALSSREIRTTNGGNISLFAPRGGLSLGRILESKASATPPGIITQFGGNVSIFTRDSVEVGVSRIFTLRGGDVTIWSSAGDIAAGSSSKTIQSAPPTRVLIDPQSANVKTDLAGLATGGGIGVLATVKGVRAGDVDLIAPTGTVDAGDAGIRATGNLNIAAFQVVNAGNIQAGGTTTGTPPPPAPPNIGGLTTAASVSGAANNAATEAVKQQGASNQKTELPSLITVEVIGYGGDGDETSPAVEGRVDSAS